MRVLHRILALTLFALLSISVLGQYPDTKDVISHLPKGALGLRASRAKSGGFILWATYKNKSTDYVYLPSFSPSGTSVGAYVKKGKTYRPVQLRQNRMRYFTGNDEYKELYWLTPGGSVTYKIEILRKDIEDRSMPTKFDLFWYVWINMPDESQYSFELHSNSAFLSK